jgi:hypothetical protein
MASSTLVDYSDLDFYPITIDQYRANLFNQIRVPGLPDNLTVEELEAILDEPWPSQRPQLPPPPPSAWRNIVQEMNVVLPEDLLWVIWKTYSSSFVMKEIVSSQKFVWENPSARLISLCKDKGCIQQDHSGLEDMIEDENMWALKDCQEIQCANCKTHGFPCGNLAWYGFRNDFLTELWEPNFVVGQ